MNRPAKGRCNDLPGAGFSAFEGADRENGGLFQKFLGSDQQLRNNTQSMASIACNPSRDRQPIHLYYNWD
jgi:hypothetical protein